MRSGDDFDQGGFTCAVFAEEGVDFAGTKIEGDTFESEDGAEGFGNPGELEQRVQSFYNPRIRRIDANLEHTGVILFNGLIKPLSHTF